jgi:hypothetical protein
MIRRPGEKWRNLKKSVLNPGNNSNPPSKKMDFYFINNLVNHNSNPELEILTNGCTISLN